MKRSRIRKIGKIGKANILANKKIKEILQGSEIGNCELQLEGCMQTWPLQVAHRHKRAWYKGDGEKLSRYSQWVIACQVCHDRIEHDKDLTEQMFEKLRGHEDL